VDRYAEVLLMRALILTPDRDSRGRRDYSGAFAPEARAFAQLHHLPSTSVQSIDCTRTAPERRKHVLESLSRLGAAGPIDLLACFCHGYQTGLQVGFDNSSVRDLARALVHHGCSPRLRVALYACSSGGSRGEAGDGGLADRLRDALCTAGCVDCVVDAHATVGHTTRNPYVRRFEGRGSPVGGMGGQWIVAPRSPLWQQWRAALASTDLRLRFPLLELHEVHRELLGPSPATISIGVT